MEKYKGKSISKVISIGTIVYLYGENEPIKHYTVIDTNKEIERFKNARNLAAEQCDEFYKHMVETIGEEEADIFKIHKMLILDEDYCGYIENAISSDKCNAEYAVCLAESFFVKTFEEIHNEYFNARANDIKDISKTINNLLLRRDDIDKINNDNQGPFIIVAEEIMPSTTMKLNKKKIAGFATKNGSENSHVSILAKAMDVPLIIGVEVSETWNSRTAIIDGNSNEIIIDPLDEQIKKAKKEILIQNASREKMKCLVGMPTVTKCGKTVNLYANIASLEDIGSVIECDAEGIGLFRSEFIFLKSNNYPTEDEQFHIYKKVAEKMKGKKVIIRTLDIGADKKAEYFNLPNEENPALGYRAIRICLTDRNLFITQLKAIYRASAYGNISVMFPMIISTKEILEVKDVIKEVKKQLDEEKQAYKDIEIGIMIETPAAALISDELAKEVDFFSIGTNDLTQYTLAIDRQNKNLDNFFNPHHRAVMELINTTVSNGHKAGIWVGICGELASDKSLTEEFIKMDIDELSVSPKLLLDLRDTIRKIS